MSSDSCEFTIPISIPDPVEEVTKIIFELVDAKTGESIPGLPRCRLRRCMESQEDHKNPTASKKGTTMTRVNNFDKFHALIDDLVSLNIKIRSKRRYPSSFHPLHRWVMDHCVVSCDVGRQTGKTEYIKRRAKKNDIVVTFNKRGPSLKSINCPVFLPQDIDKVVRQKIINTVFVDEPSLVFEKIDRVRFFSLLARNPNQTFIFLGS